MYLLNSVKCEIFSKFIFLQKLQLIIKCRKHEWILNWLYPQAIFTPKYFIKIDIF